MRLITFAIDTGAGLKRIRADVLARRWLDSIRQRSMPEVCSAPGTKLKESGTITSHLRMGESRSRVNFGLVFELVLPLLLGMTYIDRFIKSIYPAERKIVSHYSLPVLILMVHEVQSETKKYNKETCKGDEEELALLVTPTMYEPKSITFA